MRVAKEKSPTKEKLVQSAVKLMRRKGYEATSVEDICCESKLTKGSFFHYFEDKQALAKEALQAFCACQGEEMGKTKISEDPMKYLDGMIDRVIEMSKAPDAVLGCLLGNFSQELSDTHPEIRDLCATQFDAWAQSLKKLLDAAKARYVPKSAVHTESLAHHIISVMQGSMILGKAKQDTGIMRKNMEYLRQYLHHVFGK